jgi:alpha-D-ribose 1-methylphosphonate 5-triphosphate synthase subunit PhnL
MRLPYIDPQWLANAQTLMPAMLVQARFVLGWSSIFLGVMGTILPIIPGVPFLIVGSQLLGHRDRRLRWLRVRSKLLLRMLAHSHRVWIRRPATLARHSQAHTSRQIRRLRRSLQKRRAIATNHPAP